jgi:hypothetical protein
MSGKSAGSRAIGFKRLVVAIVPFGSLPVPNYCLYVLPKLGEHLVGD